MGVSKQRQKVRRNLTMLTRIITAAVSLVVFLVVLLLPQYVFVGAVAIIIAIMAHECMDCAKAQKSIRITGAISTILMVAAYVYAAVSADKAFVLPSVIAAIMLHCVTIVLEHGKIKYTDIFASGLLLIYVVITMSSIAFCRVEYGIGAMMLIFVCAWTTDSGAYFVGSFMGKHKLIPHVSPKKTIEGAVGGVVVCMLCSFVYSMIIHNIAGEAIVSLDSLRLTVIGGLGAVVAQVGDLVASSIKRDTGVKDFGKIFPGHGGFMDRFDSVIFVAPIIYGLFVIWN